jgi:hypothetical protein
MAKWGCRLAAVLAEGGQGNEGRLAQAGACETIPIIMQAHQYSEAVAGAGCDAIAFMADNLLNGFAARLGHAGACEAVVRLVCHHTLTLLCRCKHVCMYAQCAPEAPRASLGGGPGLHRGGHSGEGAGEQLLARTR